MINGSGNGWSEYKHLVLTEIDDLKTTDRDLVKTVDKLRNDITQLKERLWLHMLLTGGSAAGGSWLMDWFTK